MNVFESYTQGINPIPKNHLAWPLYGNGVSSLGKNGKPVERPVPDFADDELLMRVDAVSMCFTDVKEISQGESHPRLTGRDLMKDPIVPGHELSMTVIGVGKNLSEKYRIGDRYTMQPDVWVDGKSIPFCFGMDGGYRQYARIGKEILDGDAGNYLIPVTKDIPYAAAAITEPWACVEASYRAEYRDQLRNQGAVWIVGCEKSREGYSPDTLFKSAAPASVVISNIPEDLKAKLMEICANANIAIVEKAFVKVFESEDMFDDVLSLDCSASQITQMSAKLCKGGVHAFYGGEDAGMIEIDLGRLHYDDVFFVGSQSLDLHEGYTQTPPRVELLSGGKMLIVGAGGPMGRMHLQRALEAKNGPSLIIASEVTNERFEALKDFYCPLAKTHNKELIVVNPKDKPDEYASVMQRVMDAGGFDDIEIMITIVPVISDVLSYAGKHCVVNLFAGLKRGITMQVNKQLIQGPKQVRFIGHSGSALEDQIAVVDKMLTGELKPELSVAAVGGMMQIADGIQAMIDWKYPGKVVIYPHVLDFPLTAMHEFKEKMPEVYTSLGDGETWTKKSEEIFLDTELG